MSIFDEHIKDFFSMFKETQSELLTTTFLLEYIITNLTDAEKHLFYLRVVKGMTFYDIAKETGMTYRLAQSQYQKLADKIWEHTQHVADKSTMPTGDCQEYMNVDDKYILYNDNFLNSIYLEDKSIDLIVTSPPYNVGITYGKYEDTLDYDVYLQWTEAWLSRALKLSKDDGRLCVNVPIDCRYPPVKKPTAVDIVNAAQNVGWKYNSTIVWAKNSVNSHMATGSVFSASSPYISNSCEVILVFYNQEWKKSSGSGVSTITKQEWWKLTNALWTFPGQPKQKVQHPAPFPVQLPYNCIQLFSFADDIVLDPFIGSGTTMVAASQLGRKCIGFDIDENYLSMAKKRVQEESQITQGTLFNMIECMQPQQGVLEDGE